MHLADLTLLSECAQFVTLAPIVGNSSLDYMHISSYITGSKRR